MTTKEELDKLTDFIKTQTKQIIEVVGQQHVPVIFAFTPTGIDIIGMDELTEEAKQRYKYVVSLLLRHINADAYISVNEAWLYAANGMTETGKRILSGEIKVSELPPDDRQDVIIITVVKNHEFMEGYVANIVKTTDDRRLLCEWRKMEGVGEARMIVKEW